MQKDVDVILNYLGKNKSRRISFTGFIIFLLYNWLDFLLSQDRLDSHLEEAQSGVMSQYWPVLAG